MWVILVRQPSPSQMFSCCYIINSLSFIYIKNCKNSACHTVDHVSLLRYPCSLCILYCTITMCLMVRFRQVLHIFQRTLVSFSAQKSKRADMSRVMRKPDFCICENKDADQLRGNLRLCFHYIDSSIPLLPKSEISSL